MELQTGHFVHLVALLKSTSLNKFRSLTLKKLGATLESTSY